MPELSGRLSAASGDKPSGRFSGWRMAVCRGIFGGRCLQRSLSAARIPISGQSFVAMCKPVSDGGDGLRL